MKAMILAAGKGTRVRPLTYDLPKPMIPVVRKPVLEAIVEHLRCHGFDRIVINTSHLAPVIENYFRDGSNFGVEIAYSFEGAMVEGELQGLAIGSAGALRRVQDFSGFFDDTFVVLCGDALVDVDIGAAVRFHRDRKALATIVLKQVPAEDTSRYGIVATEPGGRILQFQEKPKLGEAVSNLANTGIYIFEPAALDYIPSGVEYDIGGQLFPAMVQAGAALYGVDLPFHWVDIGSIPDYWEATRMALRGEIAGFRLPGHEIQPGVRVGIHVRCNWNRVIVEPPVYIGSSTSIGDGARISGPTVIGSGCVIEPGAEVSEAIVSDYTRVSAAASLSRLIVSGGRCIDPAGHYVDIAQAQIGWVVDDARKQWDLPEAERELFDLAVEVSKIHKEEQ